MFEIKLQKFCKKHGLSFRWQPLRFGFQRAVFDCPTEESFRQLRQLIHRQFPSAHMEDWCCRDGGVFEGYVYLMSATDHANLQKKLRAEQEACERWWQRYHLADPNTRRLMACGQIQ